MADGGLSLRLGEIVEWRSLDDDPVRFGVVRLIGCAGTYCRPDFRVCEPTVRLISKDATRRLFGAVSRGVVPPVRVDFASAEQSTSAQSSVRMRGLRGCSNTSAAAA